MPFIRVFLLLTLITLPSRLYGLDCDPFPTKLNVLFFSASTENLAQSIACDLAFWKWGSAKLDVAEVQSFAYSKLPTHQEVNANEKETRYAFPNNPRPEQIDYSGLTVDLFRAEDYVDSEENALKRKRLKYQTASVSRIYWAELTLLGYGGVEFSYVDFTQRNSIEVQDTDIQDATTSTSLIFRGAGFRICPLRALLGRGSVFLSTCYIPSIGLVTLNPNNENRTDLTTTFDLYKSEIGASLVGFYIVFKGDGLSSSPIKKYGFDFGVNFSQSFYVFGSDIANKVCTGDDCSDQLYIWSRSNALYFSYAF